jgi:predicted nucleotidyltransferase
MVPLPPDIGERVRSLPTFFAKSDVGLAYLFGSWVHGCGKDVDLAVLPNSTKVSEIYLDVCAFLETDRVDVVNLSTTGIEFAFEVISTGRLLFSGDDETENAFETRVLRQYQDGEYARGKLFSGLQEAFSRGH